MQRTKQTKQSDIKRDWYIFDLNDKVLGRVASEIARTLMGKNKPYWVANIDCGNNVVIINARKVKVTGNKSEQKKYTRFSGYPAGLKIVKYKELIEDKPEKIIKNAVKGMLPNNKLKAKLIKRLFIYSDTNYPYKNKFK